MKSILSLVSIYCFTALFSLNASAAVSKSDALNDCKTHLKAVYLDDVRSKVKKIKKQGNQITVKMKVSSEGERFNAVCSFADGNMIYSSDRASSTLAD